MKLFPDKPRQFDVEQGPIRVCARGVSESGLLVKVIAEGQPEDVETLQERVSDFFRDARLDVAPAALNAPAKPVTVEPALPAKEEAAAAEPKSAAPTAAEVEAEPAANAAPAAGATKPAAPVQG